VQCDRAGADLGVGGEGAVFAVVRVPGIFSAVASGGLRGLEIDTVSGAG